MDDKKLVLAQHNKDAGVNTKHSGAGFSWTGPSAVFYDGKKIN
jgi:hypothetical protein